MRNKFCTFALTGLLTLGMAGSAALAQDDSTPPPPQQGSGMHGHRGMNPDAQLKHMTKQLNLSADQQSQIKPILDSRQQQMQQLWQDQSMSRQDRHQKMMSIQQDTSNQIESVLNDTQKQKYEADQAQMRQRRMHRGQGDEQPSQDSTPPAPQQ
jgi:Spy/CpxP family protein refolding chaperone